MSLLRAGWALLRQSWRAWRDDQASHQGAGLAFYALFASAPLLLLVTQVTSALFGEAAIRQELSLQLQLMMTPEVAAALEQLVAHAHAEEGASAISVAGLLASFYAGLRGFLHLQGTLNMVWGVRQTRDPGPVGVLRRKVLAFGSVLLCGTLVLASVVGTVALRSAWDRPSSGPWLALTNELGTFLLTALLLAIVYRTLPDVVIRWKDVWVGAAVSALLFLLGKHAIAWYLGGAGSHSTFGAAGSVVAILLYYYYAAQVILFGAEFTWVWAREHGQALRPARGAVQVQRVIQRG